MLGTILGIIFLIIIIGALWWGIKQLMPLLTPYIGEPFRTILYVLLVIAVVVISIAIVIALLRSAGIPVNIPRL